MKNENLVNILFSSAILLGSMNSGDVLAASNSNYSCKNKVSGLAYNNYKLRNNRVGGFVADTANLEESATLGRAAQICGYSDVQGGKVIGSGIVGGEATMLSGRVMAESYLGGDAVLNGATLKGNSKMLGGTLSKGVVLDGWYVHNSGTLTPGYYTAENPQIAINNRNRIEANRRNKLKMVQDKENARNKLIEKKVVKKKAKKYALEFVTELRSISRGHIMMKYDTDINPCVANYIPTDNDSLGSLIHFAYSTLDANEFSIMIDVKHSFYDYENLVKNKINTRNDGTTFFVKPKNKSISFNKLENIHSNLSRECKKLVR
jgi:hypothetical protein